MSDKKQVKEGKIFPKKDNDRSLRPKPPTPPTPKSGEQINLND